MRYLLPLDRRVIKFASKDGPILSDMINSYLSKVFHRTDIPIREQIVKSFLGGVEGTGKDKVGGQDKVTDQFINPLVTLLLDAAHHIIPTDEGNLFLDFIA